IVKPHWSFIDVASFRDRYGRLESCVCAIETGSGLATGFLVGPDLVLTNYHVVENMSPDAVTECICRFDYKSVDRDIIQSGRAVKLAAPPVAARPYGSADLTASGDQWAEHELDYALLRLADRIGEQPVGMGAEPGAPARGWITVSSVPRRVVE